MEILSALFNGFRKKLPRLLDLLLNEKMHLTNRESVRCFLLGILVNIFRSPSVSSHLEMVYVSSNSDTILFFVVNKEDNIRQLSGRKLGDTRMEMFVFDSANEHI